MGYTFDSKSPKTRQTTMNESQRDRRLAVSLEGDDLKRWDDYIAELREQGGLLNAAIKLNDVAVAIATPVVPVFRMAGLPLRVLGTIAFGAVNVIFRLLMIPFFAVVLSTSTFWDAAPRARILLLLITPVFVIVSLWLLALFPENPEIRDAKTSLCKLWPLSRKRLEWIRTHRIY
ncbi:MAG: hypothetical protein FI737_02485 [SAR202 cluster bacterium]|nr:hypothetical protein [SAR202 cluster bacterium]